MRVAFFEEVDQPTSIIPAKRIIGANIADLREGVTCEVQWTDKRVYPAHVLAVGEFMYMYTCANFYFVYMYITVIL